MGLAYGYLDGRADPPVPKEVDAAGQKVLKLCKQNKLFFLDNVLPDNVKQKIDMGVMIGAGSNQQAAEEGRKYTKRTMPLVTVTIYFKESTILSYECETTSLRLCDHHTGVNRNSGFWSALCKKAKDHTELFPG
jgi:hypothetical protein